MTDYPWFQTVEGDLLAQGDFLPGLEVVRPLGASKSAEESYELEVQRLDAFILSQTCDLEHGKLRNVLVSPWHDLWSFVEAGTSRGDNWGRDARETLRRGNLPGYHLVNEAQQDGLTLPIGVVDFHEVYSAPTDLVRQHAVRMGKRLRLNPPYREHLAQAFARFFMRVGLPVDIPRERLTKKPS